MVLTLPAGNASEWTGPTGNSTYLILGSAPTLIDAGVGASAHLDAVQAALDGSALACVLLTHGHSDHVGGVPAIRARWANATIMKMPPELPQGVAPLADEARIDAGDRMLTVVATPGHSPDHCCFFDAAAGDLFCGDLVRLGGTVVIAARRGGDLTDYLASLRRVRDLAPRRLLPAHGPAIDDPGKVIDQYLAHRARREGQIVAAIRAGAATPEAIARSVYAGLSAALMPAAEETVLAHLVKLRLEGAAKEADGVWMLA